MMDFYLVISEAVFESGHYLFDLCLKNISVVENIFVSNFRIVKCFVCEIQHLMKNDKFK